MTVVPFTAGYTIGRYRIVRPLGAGGSGVVYEAIDESSGCPVALKICPLPTDPTRRRFTQTRFLREARAAGQIHHANAVSIFDFGIEDSFAFLVLELVSGETLADRLKREGARPLPEVLDLLLPIFSAVAALHAAGVLHRDIKPANILLDLAGPPRAKLVDFGLSRFVAEKSSITESGAMLGTPEYMAPELVLSPTAATERSDQYALGVVLYECLTGAKPFQAPVFYDLLHQVVDGPLISPSTLEPALPPEIDAAIVRAMNREPGLRFANVANFAAALGGFPMEAAVEPDQGSGEGSRRPVDVDGTTVRIGDGIALAERGDLIIVLWKAPARMDRMRWMLDASERFAFSKPGGILALVIVLPSSSPPDGATLADSLGRTVRLLGATRRESVVVPGGRVWQAVVKNVLQAMGIVSQRRVTFSATFSVGISRLLERRSAATPDAEQIMQDVDVLFERLGLRRDPPE